MPKIVVTAAVKDVEAWLKFKPELIAQMSAVASDGTSYVVADGSNRVATTWDIPRPGGLSGCPDRSISRAGGSDGAVRDDPACDHLHREVARRQPWGGGVGSLATPRGQGRRRAKSR